MDAIFVWGGIMAAVLLFCWHVVNLAAAARRAQLQHVHRLPDAPVDRLDLQDMAQRVAAGQAQPGDLVDLGNEQHRHAYQAARDGFRDVGGFELESCCRCSADLPLVDGQYGSSPWSVCFDDEYREHIRGGEHCYRGQLCQRCAEIVLNRARRPCCTSLPAARVISAERRGIRETDGSWLRPPGWYMEQPDQHGGSLVQIHWCPFCGSRLPPCP